ncbi:hypothetical protein B9P99_00030 [Candidatus Marsarchaeota G1 archaeon OSP_B]|jgi:hypothetical protein|uniref:ArnR1-like winged helix-turn-helix domain-containing protein n=3 Tax=Candidatus Marsarchaeota group 1 TaxID=2203770 RepID=A0A2R6ACZ6_9ARCH|nr:MAG: hypothetical protein B9Q01_01660 [Candidatus Marsarchaeota G1 archaeon OSP_D]PSN89357.1 MAG: hypothetical protein B9Q00_01720 [Candidatus Marsarchaeota G1 archaeon OSP_C]PSN96927.1 MAG: hypothetical protein B9P99_00030 [Candidatus Marsarchaeota G1 archaeon OSP_B]
MRFTESELVHVERGDTQKFDYLNLDVRTFIILCKAKVEGYTTLNSIRRLYEKHKRSKSAKHRLYSLVKNGYLRPVGDGKFVLTKKALSALDTITQAANLTWENKNSF